MTGKRFTRTLLRRIVTSRTTLIIMSITVFFLFLGFTRFGKTESGASNGYPNREKTKPKELEEELSAHVLERENAALEVQDLEKHVAVAGDENAAVEVHSQEENAKSKNRVRKDDIEEADESFHYVPGHHLSYFSRTVRNNWRNLTEEEIGSLSILGRRLFLNEDVGSPKENNFTILVWKTGPKIELRHLKNYGKEKKDPFARCSVKNCKLTYEDSALSTSDAVIFHLHRISSTPDTVSRVAKHQIWIWLTDEIPRHTLLLAKVKNIKAYNGYFNWSMCYRMDCDVPVPYGRTVPLSMSERTGIDFNSLFNFKTKLVAIMGSNCKGSNNRWIYVAELKKHITVDVYGRCGTLKCPGHYNKDCSALKDYKFYLAFENGNCREYITEKAWWNALEKLSVPVVMGGRKEDYKKILPPNSFIHVEDFSSPEELAKHLLFLSKNAEEYAKYHKWRLQFKIENEHGYFRTPSYHYCRVCEALNYNLAVPKVYNNLEDFWSTERDCY